MPRSRCSTAVWPSRVIVAATEQGEYPGAGALALVRGASLTVAAAADAAIVKSGTSTLEAALADIPMIVPYRVNPITAFLTRRLVTVEWVSLVNLVAGREVVPEILQDDVTVARLADTIAPLLDPAHPATVAQREGLALVRTASEHLARRIASPTLAAALARRMKIRLTPGQVRAVARPVISILACTWRFELPAQSDLADAVRAGRSAVVVACWHEELLPLLWHGRGFGMGGW